MIKKSSNDLFQLIKSLDRAERDHFNAFTLSKRTDAAQLHIKIFDVVKRQSEYDEQKILQKLNLKKAVFFDSKKYLMRLILNSLSTFYAQSNLHNRIIHLIQCSNILLKKAMYNLAYKKIKKAKQLASQYEYFPMIFETLNIERKIINLVLNNEQQEIAISNNYSEEKKFISVYNNFIQSAELLNQLLVIYKKQGLAKTSEERKRIQLLFNSSLLKDEDQALSFRGKIVFYMFHFYYYFQINNIPKSFHYANKIVELYNKHPHMITENENVYITALHNLLSIQLELHQPLMKKFWNTMNTLKKIIPKSEHIKKEKFLAIFYNELPAYIHTANFEKGVNILSETIPEFEHYKNVISDINKVSFYFYAIYINFGANRYSEVLKWMNELLSLQSTGLRSDLFYNAKLINIITHFDRGNKEVLESTIDSLIRYTDKKKRSTQFEKIIYHYMRKIIVTEKKVELLNLYKAFKKELTDHEKKSHQNKTLEYFDIISWVESKIAGKPFSQVMKEKSK